MTDLPFGEPLTEANPAAPRPRKCLHPRQYRRGLDDGTVACTRCGADIPTEHVKRGRNNRARGNAIEREVGHRLGLKRVGQFGGATDLGESHDPFAVSVKSGSGYFSTRYWDQLHRMPVTANQTPVLVVTDAPGPGHRRRAYVVVELEAWIGLHGMSGVGEVPS